MAKSKVQINYKSGQSVLVTCDRFKVTRAPLSGHTSFEWSGIEPKPLLLGPDDVESVWELS